MITQGSKAHPVKLNDHFFGPIIKEVHWPSDPIGVLIVDIPDTVSDSLSLDPSPAWMNGNSAGDVVGRENFATSSDGSTTSPAPVSYLVWNAGEPIVRSLYGSGKTMWQIVQMMPQPGDSPSNLGHIGIAPPNPAITPEAEWTAYSDGGTWRSFTFLGYNVTKALYSRTGYRWIEVSDLKSLGSDTLMGPTGYSGPKFGETWDSMTYGVFSEHPFHSDPTNVRLTTDFLGVPVYFDFAPLLIYDDQVHVNVSQNQFDPYAPATVVGWGLGEKQLRSSPGSNLVRRIYFLDFKIIGTKFDTNGGQEIETTGDISSDGLHVTDLALFSHFSLTSGRNYSISGDGVVAGTRFIFDGSAGGTLSKVCTKGTGVSLAIRQDRVYISNNFPSFDKTLGEFDSTFQFTLYSGATKFTLTSDSVTADLKPIIPSVTKTASYYKDGALFEIDRKGFVPPS